MPGPEWIPLAGGIATLLTAITTLVLGNRKHHLDRRKLELDLLDQVQEERNRMDAKFSDSEAKHAATNARVDVMSSSFNSAMAVIAVQGATISIQESHIGNLESHINRVDPPAPARPVLPTMPPMPTAPQPTPTT